jgi:C-terminal processing protease CtpA/Prc
MIKTIRKFFSILLLFPITLFAQPGPPADGPIDSKMQKEVIDSLAAVLTDGYYDLPTAQLMVSQLRKFYKSGRYDTLKSGRQFAMELTKDLREVSKDKHLLVDYVNADASNVKGISDEQRKKQAAFMNAVNHGFDKVERLPGNVGLLALRTFSTIEETAIKIDAAMNLLSDADALIIDLRYNSGGHPASVQYLVSYLFDSKPRLINTLLWRSSAGNQGVNVSRNSKGPGMIEQFWTLPALPAKRFGERPVYVLISEITASGAESFAYFLQATKRAVIVGGTSSGAANPGGTERLTSNFEVFVPRGQAYNSITKTSWERVGVKPDISCSFEQSLQVAYIQALEQVDKRGTYAGPEPLKILIDDAKAELSKLNK